MERRVLSPDSALASDIFDQFCTATTLKSLLALHRKLTEAIHLRPTNFPQFYPKLKGKLKSWRAQALWTKFDKRASHKCYARGHACADSRVLIIGAGPCGLRAAVEAQLLGAKVVVIEKRDRISRNNVLHLWPFVIHDLRALGAKKFFGKFCAGAIDHISIRQLQVILLKVALLLGVEVHIGVSFEGLIAPPEDQNSRVGWRADVLPADHAVSQYEFDVLIGADGKRNTLEGFGRKEFRGKLAIAITANFLNRRTEAEARVEEISGVAFIFNQKFFKDLYQATGIDLENIVYYKDDTHYFVMTAKKHSLIYKGVIISDQADTARLLSPDNVNREALMEYAHEAADFSTQYQLPTLEFAVNHYGQPDVAMFDFTSMYAAESATRVIERKGHRLLTQLVGDSLLEPFWPTGSGCARGFLSSMDACWALRSWCNGVATPLEVAAERESIYRLLAQTTPENLSKDFNSYTLEPQTRYPNLNLRSVLPIQVKNLVDTDNPEMTLQVMPAAESVPTKRRRKESDVHPDTLLMWLKRQVALYDTVKVENVTSSFRNGMALGAIVHHYRSDLVNFSKLEPQDAIGNNKFLFDLLQKEYGISPVMSAAHLATSETPDELCMLSYLSQVYDAFRGEIPHSKPNIIEEEEVIPVVAARRLPTVRTVKSRLSSSGLTQQHKKRSSLERDQPEARLMGRAPRKRRSHEKDMLESAQRREQLDADKEERAHRRRMLRHLNTQSFVRSMQMLRNSRSEYEPEDRPEDPDLAVYRQYAPQFSARVKELEGKFTYQPDREAKELADKKGLSAENFSGRVKELEAKFKGTAPAEKKPRDLLRSIGKIERSDWNMAVIERKIEENRMGRNKARGAERVPKWNREKFADKFSAVERKLRAKSSKEDDSATKFADIDDTLKRLDRKIREGSTLDTVGPRGANKVSAMAEQLATKLEPSSDQTQPPIQKSSSKSSVVLPSQSGASDSCHFCNKRVYLMERLSAEGKFFHRGCFRCEYCATSLRPNNYAFDRDGKYGSRFVCTQHFGMDGHSKQGARARRKSEDLRAVAAAEAELVDSGVTPSSLLRTPKLKEDVSDNRAAGVTPERVEFENLAGGSDDDLSEVRPVSSQHVEMDEDEWTDHNFGASCADDDSSGEDETDSTSDSDDDAEAYEEALGEPLSVEETRQLAETWQRRYSGRAVQQLPCITVEGSEISDNDDPSSDGDWSCDRDEIEDEDSSTATEGDAVARELLKQEERLRERAIRRRHRSQDSETEVASDCTSTETDSEEEAEEEEENLATEIETDSEFELDCSLPTIIADSKIQVCHVTSLPRGKHVRGNLRPSANSNKVTPSRKPLTKPSVPPPEMTPAVLKHRPTNFPGLDLKLKQKELLNRTHSTEGIASKMSLELKKRYLLGGDSLAFNKNVQKSGSASALDSKFRSFVDQISEQQKLLQPAANPSPTMQAFLESKVSPNRASPLLTSMSSSNILLSNRSDVINKLPKVPSSFIHVCGKNEVLLSPPEIKITPDIDDEATPIVETKDIFCNQGKEENVTNFDDNNKYSPESDKILDLQKEKYEANVEDLTPNADVLEDLMLDPDYRPRSPAHETSIIVPDKSEWQDKKKSENVEESSESGSEDSETESEYDDSVEETPQVKTVPRLEITDSDGGVLQNELSPDKDVVCDTELSDWAQEVEDNSVDFDEFQLDTKNVTFRKQKLGNPTLAVEDDLSEECNPKVDIPKENNTEVDFEKVPKVDIMIVSDMKIDNKIVDETKVCPKIDVMTVSDTIKPSIVSEPVKSNTESEMIKSVGSTFDDIDFMDSEDDSEFNLEKSEEATNIPVIVAYQQLNEENNHEVIIPADDSSTTESISKSSDNFGTTPDTELENLVLVEAINAKLAKTSDEESLLLVDTDTTTSDATTLVYVDTNKNSGLKCSPTNRPLIDPSYEAHVKRLQGRISPFSNAKDSIDIRKSRKSSSSSSPSHSIKEELKIDSPLASPKKSSNNKYESVYQPRTMPVRPIKDDIFNSNSTQVMIIPKEQTIIENSKLELQSSSIIENSKLELQSPSVPMSPKRVPITPFSANKIPNTPSTSRKLEELSRERSKQKDLIADMVISKLGSNSLERKRTQSGGPRKRLSSKSPSRSPLSLIGPPISPPPLPPTNKLKLDDMESVMPKYGNHKSKENVHDDDDVFVTPRNVKKNTVNSRPFSVYASFKAPEFPSKPPELLSKTPDFSSDKLPETPLTHPEAFSCPDIRRALFAEENRDKIREKARAKARLLSDRELGLSPENNPTLSALREKAKSRLDKTPIAPPRSKKKSETKFYVDEEVKTEPLVTKRSAKKPKDRERRRSLIQAMSEFFTRKKEGASPSTSPSKSPSSKLHSKSTHKDDLPPPLPPLPAGYMGAADTLVNEVDDSPSEGEDSRVGECASSSMEISSLRRSSRSARRQARQAQLKRLRMAHELQRLLEQLEVKQRILEERGVTLEKALRGEDASASTGCSSEVALLQEWFQLMRERSDLRRYERELGIRAQELELQERHAKLQADLRERMAEDDSRKSSAEVAEEGRILSEMLEIVEQKDSLIAVLEEDRQRYVEEDKDIEAQMLAKGLRLTPLRKESNV